LEVRKFQKDPQNDHKLARKSDPETQKRCQIILQNPPGARTHCHLEVNLQQKPPLHRGQLNRLNIQDISIRPTRKVRKDHNRFEISTKVRGLGRKQIRRTEKHQTIRTPRNREISAFHWVPRTQPNLKYLNA
jgi:hypothetical protein